MKCVGRGGSRHALASLVTAGSLALEGCAGGHLQAGPMLGFSSARGMTWGWEAGAGELGVLRVSTGGSYRAKLEPEPEPEPEPERVIGDPDEGSQPQAKAPPADYVHYLALEPLGLSLGVDYSSTGEAGLMAGIWAGWVVDPNPDGAFGFNSSGPFRPDVDCPDYDPEPALLLSAAFGLRYLGGEWEAYLTPKAVLFYCFEYAN